MPKRPPRFESLQTDRIGVADLQRAIDGWLLDGQVRQHSPRTVELHRMIGWQLMWFLKREECVDCGALELKRFLIYVGATHAGGRWGNPANTRPARPRTVDTYRGRLKTLFAWILAEGLLDVNPMATVPAPIHRASQIQPFSDAQITDLLAASRQTDTPRRDEAIVMLLLDTGMRVSELVGLQISDLDQAGRRATITGKGNKSRTVYYSATTSKAIWQYLRSGHKTTGALFTSLRGRRAGEPLTRSGVQQMIERLGIAAGLTAVRCSPHTFRHTFAIMFLRAGGNQFSLMEILGHTGVQQTSAYVRLAAADIEAQSRRCSPVDRITRGRSQ